MGQNFTIRPARAERLYEQLGNWRRVGEQLAKEDGRPLPYLGGAVMNAVRAHRLKRDKIPLTRPTNGIQ
jgi:hypothetical protein